MPTESAFHLETFLTFHICRRRVFRIGNFSKQCFGGGLVYARQVATVALLLFGIPHFLVGCFTLVAATGHIDTIYGKDGCSFCSFLLDLFVGREKSRQAKNWCNGDGGRGWGFWFRRGWVIANLFGRHTQSFLACLSPSFEPPPTEVLFIIISHVQLVSLPGSNYKSNEFQ